MSNQTRTQAGFMRLVTAINTLKDYTDTEIADAVAAVETDYAGAIATASTADRNADNHTSGTNNKVFTAAEQTKLGTIAQNANVYTDTDADARVLAFVGDKSTLTTVAKNTIVAALNELDAAIAALAGESGAIDDGATDIDTTWSSSKTATEIANAVAALANGAPEALNSIDELAAALNDNPAQITDILTALGNRVRFDAAQTLTGPQQAQARSNIGAVASADVGNTDYDYVADIEAALA